MKVIVNWALCDGNGDCARAAPELFALDDADKVKVLQETVSDALRAKAKAAVRACPKSALSLSE